MNGGDYPIENQSPADDIDHDRRRFVGTATMALAAAQLGMIGPAEAQQRTKMPAIKPGTTHVLRVH